MCPYLGHAPQCFLEGAEGGAPVVAGQHADVVVDIVEQFDQPMHCTAVNIHMHITDMQDSESGKCGWQSGQRQGVVPELYSRGVLNATRVEADDLQGIADQGVRRVPVFDVEEIQAAAEHLYIGIGLDTKPLVCIKLSQALFESFDIIRLHSDLENIEVGEGWSNQYEAPLGALSRQGVRSRPWIAGGAAHKPVVCRRHRPHTPGALLQWTLCDTGWKPCPWQANAAGQRPVPGEPAAAGRLILPLAFTGGRSYR